MRAVSDRNFENALVQARSARAETGSQCMSSFERPLFVPVYFRYRSTPVSRGSLKGHGRIPGKQPFIAGTPLRAGGIVKAGHYQSDHVSTAAIELADAYVEITLTSVVTELAMKHSLCASKGGRGALWDLTPQTRMDRLLGATRS